MKKIALSGLVFLFFATAAQAKIWRVNNMPGVTADATTAQAAHNLAASGDTIHLEPSSNAYGNVSSNKRLVWLSVGYYLNSGMQAATNNGIIGTITFGAGSEGSVAMVVSTSDAYVYCNNITINRSFINGYIYNFGGAISGLVISQSVINAGSISLANAVNAVVTNNIVGYAIVNDQNGTAIVTNNVIGVYSTQTGTLYNSVFQNNILRGNQYNFYNSQISYNTTSSPTGIPAGDNNVLGADLTTIFENDGVIYQGGRSDRDYRLKAGSPAIGTGAGGFDRGAFGGSSPYVLGLQAPIPAITSLSSPASNNANTIQVTFSAKSNQ